MLNRIAVGVLTLAALMLTPTSEARGGRASHKVPREHRHKTDGRCKDSGGRWIRGACEVVR